MKNHLFLPIAVLVMSASCAKESVLPERSTPSQSPAFLANQLPTYTEPELQALISNADSEAMLVAKTERLTFALTRFLGEHSGLQNNGNLSAHLPCDMGLTDPVAFCAPWAKQADSKRVPSKTT